VNAEDIKPGAEIIVPRGADGIRKLPYRLLVDTVNVSKVTGAVTVTGRLQRLTGAPSAKKRTAAWRTVTFGLTALAKVRLPTEEDGR
jgi:hypothetical protein